MNLLRDGSTAHIHAARRMGLIRPDEECDLLVLADVTSWADAEARTGRPTRELLRLNARCFPPASSRAPRPRTRREPD